MKVENCQSSTQHFATYLTSYLQNSDIFSCDLTRRNFYFSVYVIIFLIYNYRLYYNNLVTI